MKKILWDTNAWEEYLYWQKQDKKTLNKINKLLESIARDGYKCIGKPEPLKHELSGCWSIRINDIDRLLFKIYDEYIEIIKCRTHYQV